jgi:hypothetical protein
MIPLPSHNTVGVVTKSHYLLYYTSSRLVTILKITDAPIQVSDIGDRTVSFKLLNFSFQIYLLYVPAFYTCFISENV